MKKTITVTIFLIVLLLPFTVNAESMQEDIEFCNLFEDHGTIMLLIDSKTGSILFANKAAAGFYGYTMDQLESMNITQINTLRPEETNVQMQASIDSDKNNFIFNHRLADGDVRIVEVSSYPVKYGDGAALFSIIHDITELTLLEQRQKNIITGIILGGGVIIGLLSLLIILLLRNSKKIKLAKEAIENFNALKTAFINADDRLVYLKDENLKYVFVNKAVEDFYHMRTDDVIGFDDFSFGEAAFAQKRRDTDLTVLEESARIEAEVVWNGRIFKTTKFPIKMLNGKYGVGAYVEDITEVREHEIRREKMLCRHKILVDVLDRHFTGRQEQLDYVLHEALKLTESQYGYIYLYDEEKKEFILNSWTRGVMNDCEVVEKQTRYQLDKTGIWGEVVRQRNPIVVNDFERSNPLKKGHPQGHISLTKFMSIPVIMDEKIVATVGLANKQTDYDANDVYEMTLLMNGVWQNIERQENQEKFISQRNKYLQTLISIGDGVMVVDNNGYIEMLNHIAQKLTGWSLDDARGRHYKEVFVLSHEYDGVTINDPIEEVFVSGDIQELDNHAVLTARDGTRYYLEDSAAPIWNDTGVNVGVVLVFRDVTEKKEQRRRIEYLSEHDSLTGLYNRLFLEKELHRLDNQENLPISIIMGDVNGLKMTNDIFGHVYGDMLLKKVSEILACVCRNGDIVARWGGDEFVILLPKTNIVVAEHIVKQIKEEFSREQIKSIKGSISMGFAAKKEETEDIEQILSSAEEKMYIAKTLEHDEAKSEAIRSIIEDLHRNSAREKAHSIHVRALSRKIGKAMDLSDIDIRKVMEAGYLHDIGKIVLDQHNRSTDSEWYEKKKHPIVGFRIMNTFDETMDLAELVLAHHERWDGTGYPKGLKKEEIPLLARIISVAESYDRMVYDENSTVAMRPVEAINRLREMAGTKFDSHIVGVLAQVLEE